MNIDEKIEELRKEFNEKIEKLKEEYKKEKSRKWIPKHGEKYFYLIPNLKVFYSTNDANEEFDKKVIKYNKIFKTYEEAQEYVDYLKARKEYSYEFSKEEWENGNIEKYFIYYDYNELKISCFCRSRHLNQINFKSWEKAQKFIDKYKKQILKFEFGIEE